MKINILPPPISKLRCWSAAVAVMLATGINPPGASAQAVIFPQEQQAGTASSTTEGQTFTLSNDLLSASFVKGEDGTLAFGGAAALGLLPGGDIFTIRLADGTTFAGSSIQWASIEAKDAPADKSAARGSLKLPGKMIEAKATVSGLDLIWRAILRDGSHYLRTEIELTNPATGEAVPMASLTPMIYSVDQSVTGDVSVVGNTRGAILASPKIFAGIETPMGKNSIGGREAVVNNLRTTGWSAKTDWDSWHPETLPEDISAMDYMDGNMHVTPTTESVDGMHGYMYFPVEGSYTVSFKYVSGNCGIHILGIDGVNIKDDTQTFAIYEKKITPGDAATISYTLDIPAEGVYEMQIYRSAHDNFTSNPNGSIEWTGPDGVKPMRTIPQFDNKITDPVITLNKGYVLPTTWAGHDLSTFTNYDDISHKLLNYTAARVGVVREHAIEFTTGAEGAITAHYAYKSGSHARHFLGVSLFKVNDDGTETFIKNVIHHPEDGNDPNNIGSNASADYDFGSQPAGSYKVLAYSYHTISHKIGDSTTATGSDNSDELNNTSYEIQLDGTAIEGTAGDSPSGQGWDEPVNPALIPEEMAELYAIHSGFKGYVHLNEFLGYNDMKIKVTGEAASDVTIALKRTNGTFNNGIGVELLDTDGTVVKSVFYDHYNDFTEYTLPDVPPGNYTLRLYFLKSRIANTNVNENTGGITFTSNIEPMDGNEEELQSVDLTLPQESSIVIQGLWERPTSIQPGKTWQTGSVVGLIADGGTGTDQSRRSVLAYIERERAVPWRSMPIYNSWYELNINRNNDQNYTNNMNITQCVDVVNQWYENLYKKNGTNIGSFVWDDGWDFYGPWTFSPNFPNGFTEVDNVAKAMGTGIGAWLGPVGGYGQSGNYRRAYWSGKGGMQLSNPAYYDAFLSAVSTLTSSYDFRYFKFDGISAQAHATGPDSGAAGTENAEGIIDIETQVRKIKPDIFLNTTVGTWASPFWYHYSDATWRQENDWGKLSGSEFGDDREAWISYRDNLVHDVYVTGSPLCPINSIMTHGVILTKFGSVSQTMNYDGIVREMRAAFACGTGQVELYCDYGIMNTLTKEGKEPGDLWAELAVVINWQRKNADVLPDAHWVGGDPSDAEVYGWASWNGRKATLALRNPKTSPQTYTFTLAEALELPGHCTSTFTFTKAFEDQADLTGFDTDQALDPATSITVTLPANTIFVFDGIDSNFAEAPIKPDYEIVVDNKVDYTLVASDKPYPGKIGVRINKTLTPEPIEPYHFEYEVDEDGDDIVSIDGEGNVSFFAPGHTVITVKAILGAAPSQASTASLLADEPTDEPTDEPSADETENDDNVIASQKIDVTVPAATVTANNYEPVLARDHEEYNHTGLPSVVTDKTASGITAESSDFTLPAAEELALTATPAEGLELDSETGHIKVSDGNTADKGTVTVSVVKKDSDPLITYGSTDIDIALVDAVKDFGISSDFPEIHTVGAEPLDLAKYVTIVPGHESFVNIRPVMALADDNEAEAATLSDDGKLGIDGAKLTGAQTARISVTAHGRDAVTQEIALHRLMTDMTISSTKTSGFRKGDTFTLTADALTADNGAHTETITWTSSNDKVATVDSDGNVTITGTSGNATITATASPSGMKKTFEVKLGGYTVTGIDTVTIDNLPEGAEIYTTGGVRMASDSLTTLAPGIYIIRLADGQIIKTIKR